jgi:hypothetical protein
MILSISLLRCRDAALVTLSLSGITSVCDDPDDRVRWDFAALAWVLSGCGGRQI